jgi:hypothetical protein
MQVRVGVDTTKMATDAPAGADLNVILDAEFQALFNRISATLTRFLLSDGLRGLPEYCRGEISADAFWERNRCHSFMESMVSVEKRVMLNALKSMSREERMRILEIVNE